jgi:hypothetical protein
MPVGRTVQNFALAVLLNGSIAQVHAACAAIHAMEQYSTAALMAHPGSMLVGPAPGNALWQVWCGSAGARRRS